VTGAWALHIDITAWSDLMRHGTCGLKVTGPLTSHN